MPKGCLETKTQCVSSLKVESVNPGTERWFVVAVLILFAERRGGGQHSRKKLKLRCVQTTTNLSNTYSVIGSRVINGLLRNSIGPCLISPRKRKYLDRIMCFINFSLKNEKRVLKNHKMLFYPKRIEPWNYGRNGIQKKLKGLDLFLRRLNWILKR